MLNYIQKRQISPEYLLLQIQQKHTKNQELQQDLNEKNKQLKQKTQQLKRVTNQLQEIKSKTSKEILNLNLALRKLQNSKDALQNEKAQLQYQQQILNNKITQTQQQNKKLNIMNRDQFQLIKAGYLQRIANLQNNLNSINKFYNLNQTLKNDRQQLIKDFQKQNQKSNPLSNNNFRATILQNQQLSNQLQYQSQQIVNLLTRNQKLTQQVAYFKRQMQIHKQVQNDLVKRSSLAQNVIKQLNIKLKDIQIQNKALKQQIQSNNIQNTTLRQNSRGISKQQSTQYKSEIKKLTIQISNLKNQINYLENKSRFHQTKYQSLAVILSHYLQNLILYQKQSGIYNDIITKQSHITIDINSLKQKQLKQWKAQQTEAIVHLLLTQIKPLLSKKSLTSFPQTRNINISLVEEPNKEPISLPKIANQHQQVIQNDKKKQNRFKDVPLDISTKIVRSNLRNWGQKVDMSSKQKKSNSFYEPRSLVGS